jgi:hypothetical protein
LYLVLDENEFEVGRVAITYHARECSWTVLRSTEDALAPLFGERWMEDQ